jgi:hypothetical protein
MGFSGQNLLKRLQSMDDAYVVDSNIDWLSISGRATASRTGFVLGTTFDKEVYRLQAIFQRPTGERKTRENVFLFGMNFPSDRDVLGGIREPYLMMSLLDKNFLDWVDIEGVRNFDSMRAKWDTNYSVRASKGKALSLLKIQAIDELGRPSQHLQLDDSLKATIERERPQCPLDFWRSEEVAMHAFARLLIRSQRARNEFTSEGPNLFGDEQLIQNALFLGAKILSKDNNVHTMAGYCGVRCFRDLPQPKPRRVGP